MKTEKYYRGLLTCVLFVMITACTPNAAKQDHLPYYTSADFTPHWLDTRSTDTIHTIPDFSFVNQSGEIVTRHTFDNRITVVDFFFTSCPGICKKLTRNLALVQTAFKDDSEVLLLSHSVTPEHDNVAVLKKYAQLNGAIPDKWNLVTGEKLAIYTIARSAYFADEDLGLQQDSSSFLHTENILLIDKKHHIRGVYKGTMPAEITNLIDDIKKLKTE